MLTSSNIIKEYLVPLGKQEHAEKGQTIILEGSQDDDLFYILKGKAKAVNINSEGHITHLATFSEGDIIGYFAFLTNSQRTATVITEESSVLVRISSNKTQKAIEKYPELKDKLMISMANEFINTKEKLIASKSMPAYERVFSILKENAKEDGSVLTPRGWKTKQAEILGMSREHFSRHLSSLQKRNIIKIDSDYIFIIN